MGDWQTIDSAPKDGKMFLGWVDAVRYGEDDEGRLRCDDVSDHDFCRWNADTNAQDGGWFENMMGPVGDSHMITHWMPLPKRPSTQEPTP